ncbi:phosphatase [Olsenella uli]|uniref:PHP domain-containing protein n=1 Tax=Olsenella uli TaxID=133926 RepID=UPI00195C10FC|nr:PHP domain-containing protein [Olsenella uli]MBM6676156.1 phosphatase [Olsenella uli]
MLQNRCDVHTHTLFSRHSYSTVRENVLAARDAGLELLGVADHFSDMLYPSADLTHADVRDYQHFVNAVAWPRTWEGIRLLRGAEADVRTLDGRLFGQDVALHRDLIGIPLDGTETLYDRVVASCDYVIASVHYREFARDATVAQGTEMYLGALEQPKVLVLGHTGRAGVPFDVPELVGEAARQHKLVEINAHSLELRRREGRTWRTCRAIAEACAELGCQVAVSSDAHVCCDVGSVAPALEMLEEIHFPQELVATRSAEAFLAAMAAAGLDVPRA